MLEIFKCLRIQNKPALYYLCFENKGTPTFNVIVTNPKLLNYPRKNIKKMKTKVSD